MWLKEMLFFVHKSSACRIASLFSWGDGGVCVDLCVCAFIFLSIHVCMHVCMSVCVCVHVCACVNVCIIYVRLCGTETVDALIMAIQNFEGGVMMVSHDQHLLSACVEEFWAIHEKKVFVKQNKTGTLICLRLLFSFSSVCLLSPYLSCLVNEAFCGVCLCVCGNPSQTVHTSEYLSTQSLFSFCLFFSLSLSHTHTHTHLHCLSPCLSVFD